MADHKHNWILSHYIFPENDVDEGTYEHDVPYRVEICDPECGQRRTVEMKDDEVAEVRALYSIPAEVIKKNGLPVDED